MEKLQLFLKLFNSPQHKQQYGFGKLSLQTNIGLSVFSYAETDQK